MGENRAVARGAGHAARSDCAKAVRNSRKVRSVGRGRATVAVCSSPSSSV
jgi:hypothetical protein